MKLFDTDSRFKYSNVVTGKPGKNPGIAVWPNPFKSFITINVNVSQPQTFIIRLADMAGRVLNTYERDFARGATQITINEIGEIAKGVYILEMIDKASGEKSTYRLFKD